MSKSFPLSFKNNDKDNKLKHYLDSKGGKSAWIKEAMQEKMDRELGQSIIVSNVSYGNNNYDIPMNDDYPKFQECDF